MLVLGPYSELLKATSRVSGRARDVLTSSCWHCDACLMVSIANVLYQLQSGSNLYQETLTVFESENMK